MELRDYQEDISSKAADILTATGLVYLAMQVRTGKTLTALATAKKAGAKLVLFVTKLKAISSIDKDFEAYSPGFEMVVVNFESLHKVDAGFDLVIIDEAHSLGAFPKPSQRAEELRRIIREEDKVIYLSGTPSPESYSQLFHQLWVSRKGPWVAFSNFYKWAKTYVDIKKKYLYNREINDYSSANEELVMNDVKPLTISFTQEEAGFEALVEEHIINVQMKPSTYKLAERLRQDQIFTGSDGSIVLADTAVKLMQKLHQIYSGSVICDEPERLVKSFDESKVIAIREAFAGKKIAIFYKFIGERELIRFHIGREVTEDVDAFAQAGPELVFMSQVQSGREGLNLSSADALIFFNIDFASVSYWQARARLQTKDRTEPAHVYWVFSIGGIEEKIYQRVIGKNDYTLNHFKKDFYVKATNVQGLGQVPNHRPLVQNKEEERA